MWRAVVVFAVGSSVALLALVVGGAPASRHVAEQEAVRDARHTTDVLASSVIRPVLQDGLLTGDAPALRRLDEAVRRSVLSGPLVRVKLWTPAGRIVYSDQRN